MATGLQQIMESVTQAQLKSDVPRMDIGDTVLMASDAPPDFFRPAQGFSVCLSVAEIAEAERVFHALAEGGTVKMPIAETFWAVRFGMLVDRFGTPWMVNCEKPH